MATQQHFRLEVALYSANIEAGAVRNDLPVARFTFWKFAPEDVAAKSVSADGRVTFGVVKSCTFALPFTGDTSGSEAVVNGSALLLISLVDPRSGHELGTGSVTVPVVSGEAQLVRQTLTLLDRGSRFVGRFDLATGLTPLAQHSHVGGATAPGAIAITQQHPKGSIGELLQFAVYCQFKSCCEYLIAVLKREHSHLARPIDAVAVRNFSRIARSVRRILHDLNIVNQLTIDMRKGPLETVGEHHPTLLSESAEGTVAHALQFDVLYQLRGAVSLLGGILRAPQDLDVPLSSVAPHLAKAVERLTRGADDIVREVNVLVQSTLDNALQQLARTHEDSYSSSSSSNEASSSSSSAASSRRGRSSIKRKTKEKKKAPPPPPLAPPPPPEEDVAPPPPSVGSPKRVLSPTRAMTAI